MGNLLQTVKGFKVSLLKFRTCYNLQTGPSVSPSESFQAPYSVCPVDQVLELSTSSTNITCIASEVSELPGNNMMLLKEGPVNISGGESLSFKGMS